MAKRPANRLGLLVRVSALAALLVAALASGCDPADAKHRAAGTILFNQKKYEEALVEFKKAVTAAPSEAGNHILVGNALLELARPAEARAAYEEALKRDPQAGEAHRALAILVAQTAAPGDRAAAQEFRGHIEAVVKARPRDRNALTAAGYTLSRYADPTDTDAYREAQKRAEELLEQALGMDERSPTILFNLAVVRARRGDLKTALTVIERLEKIAPREGFSAYARAVVHTIAGDREAALAQLDTLLQVGSIDPDSLREDPLLEALRADPRFAAALEGARRRRSPGAP